VDKHGSTAGTKGINYRKTELVCICEPRRMQIMYVISFPRIFVWLKKEE
jgi:hypothetical protein